MEELLKIKKNFEPEELYKNLVENLQDAIVVVDLKGKCMFVNKATEKLTGYKKEEMIGRNVRKIIPRKYWPLCEKMNELAFTGKPVPYFEMEIINKNGKLVQVETGGQVVKKDGKIVGIQIITRDITKRKRVEKEIERTKEFLENIFETTSDLVCLIDLEGRFLTINKAVKERMGYEENDLIGKLKRDFVVNPEQLDATLKKVLKKGKLTNLKMKFRKKDGSIADILYSATLLKDKDGNPIGIVTFGKDVTEREKMQKALEESEKKYRTLFENVNDAVFIADVRTGILLYANKKAEILTGKTREELIGMHQSKIHPPEKAEYYKKIFKEHIKHENVVDVEGEIQRKNGSIVPVLISANVFELEGKKVIQGIFRDITERKKMQKALEESEKKYRMLIENAVDPIVVLDKKGKFINVNKKVEEILGYKREELIGKKFTEAGVLTKKSKLIASKNFARRMAGFEVKPYEVEIIKKNGGIIIGEINAALIRHEGKIIGDMIIIRDITERKRVEEELKKEKEFSENILNTMPDGLDIVDQNCTIRFMNKAFLDVFGKESIGKKCYEVYKIDKKQCDNCPLKKPIKIGETKTIEVSGIVGGKTFLISHIGIRNPDGSLAILEIFKDITKRKKVEKKLRKKIEELERFHKMTVGRELRMIELKKKVRKLEKRIGR
jgi:PAS domain S-box-containing protein